MATLRSRATDISHHRSTTMYMRRLQEGLYTHLDEQEKGAFIEVLNTYGVRKDIFELVNSLRKILNTPVKRQLFPLVRRVIRKSDMEAFDLLTRGGKSYGTLPRPFLYRPHAADISVLRKHRTMTLNRYNEISYKRKSRSLASDVSDVDEPPLPSSRDIHKVFIETRDINYDGFGFNIRGGSEYGLGVYVSSVDEGGPAEIQGLQIGDLIVEANDISFHKISHGEAARMLKAAIRLELSICRVGRVPGNHTVHETYKWVDSRGRPVSPPPDLITAGHVTDDVDTRSRSSLNLLKGSDERKVNVVVDRGHSLGLTVRGGRDYRLGVYISGVDPYSVAENAGLKIGDQILDVNGQSMAGVSHTEAVRTLTRCRHMVLTVKDVGRVPYAKTTIDRTQWLSREASEALQSGPRHSRFSGRRSVSEPDLMNVGFSRGAGSQLMLSAMSTRSHYDIVEQQARVLLNTEEQATLRYYLTEYSRDVINVSGFVSALLELFNTGAKFTLMSEIRPLMQPKDLDMFDRLVRRQEIHTGLGGMVKGLDADSLSLISGDSADVYMDDHNKRTLFSTKIKPVMKPKMMDALTVNIPTTTSSSVSPSSSSQLKVPPEREVQSRSASVEQWDIITDSPSENGGTSKHEQAPRLTKPVPFTRGQAVRRQKPHSRLSRPRSPAASVLHVSTFSSTGTSPASSSAAAAAAAAPGRVSYTKAEVHPRAKHVDDPSDDSGVEVNNHPPLDPRSLHGLDGVTISKAGPVDIDTAVSRQSTDTHLTVTSPVQPFATAVSAHVNPRAHRNVMDRCLELSTFRIPRPQVYTPLELALLDQERKEEQRRVNGRDRYGDIPLGVVYIYRCKPTLGVAIEGGANTRQPLPRVVTVQPGGSAFESGGLRVGHVILEVNGVPLVGKSHTEAAKLIAETFKNREEERMELLVTDSSDSVMDELRAKLAELAVDK